MPFKKYSAGEIIGEDEVQSGRNQMPFGFDQVEHVAASNHRANEATHGPDLDYCDSEPDCPGHKKQ